MSKHNDCWGIEVGAAAIKAMRLTATPEGVKLLDHDLLPFKQILTTPDLDVNEAVQVNLDQFLQRHDVRKSGLWVSVPGHMGFARFAKLPPVEPKKIADIVKFEAVQQIPFPIDQVEWDYQVFQQKDSPDVEVGIFAIAKDRVNQFLANFQAVGMQVDGLTLSPLAVFNAVHHDLGLEPSGEGLVIVDIGASNTDVMVTTGDSLWLRTLSIGGSDFTEALVKAFKLSLSKAEKLKREAATSKYARQVFQAMRPVFADLVQELQRSLGYYQSLNREATLKNMLGVGSTFRLPGLQKFLRQQLQMDVKRLDAFARLQIADKQTSDFEQHAPNMATAYGLALQGLGLHRVKANILPAHVIRQRTWRAKQPWFAAAAALVVLAIGWNVATLWAARSSYDDSGFVDAERVVQKAKEYQKQAEDLTAAAGARDRIESIRRLLDGKSIVPLLLQDVQLAAAAVNPQPETLLPDYEKIASIPRDQRRRLYIDSITLQYRSASSDDKTASADAAAESTTEAAAPASFLINVKGSTPFRDGAAFFTETFIAWLRKNTERQDRPYRIVLKGNPLVMFDRSQEPAAPLGKPGAPPPPFALSPGAMPQFNESGQSVGQAVSADLASLLPPRPLSDEPRSGDWRFEVQWTVDLLPPDKVRQAEDLLAQGQAPDAAAQPAPQPRETPAPATEEPS